MTIKTRKEKTEKSDDCTDITPTFDLMFAIVSMIVIGLIPTTTILAMVIYTHILK